MREMETTIAIEELRSTVERMEAHLSTSNDELTTRLMKAYELLVTRFEADLGDERDVLLSRAAALMLIQEAASQA
jgi:hypothetical protein